MEFLEVDLSRHRALLVSSEFRDLLLRKIAHIKVADSSGQPLFDHLGLGQSCAEPTTARNRDDQLFLERRQTCSDVRVASGPFDYAAFERTNWEHVIYDALLLPAVASGRTGATK